MKKTLYNFGITKLSCIFVLSSRKRQNKEFNKQTITIMKTEELIALVEKAKEAGIKEIDVDNFDVCDIENEIMAKMPVERYVYADVEDGGSVSYYDYCQSNVSIDFDNPYLINDNVATKLNKYDVDDVSYLIYDIALVLCEDNQYHVIQFYC